MKKKWLTVLACLALVMAGSAAYAMYSVANRGTWPATWPKELEPLRAKTTTLVGPMTSHEHYKIPFTQREEFEAAWPHFLKVKSEGAPIFLVKAPKTDFMDIKPAGVLIHSPPKDTNRAANPEAPLPGDRKERQRWMWTTYIELVVDGQIVDLNRIPMPQDTPIIDERF